LETPLLQNPFSLEGESALITGGGTGLGLAMAQCLAQCGAKVAIVGRRAEVIEASARSIHPSVLAISGDVAEARDRERMLATCHQSWGHAPTILINNAGINQKKPAEEVADEDFINMFNVHVASAFALSKLSLPAMKARGRGCIINIASMASLLGIPKVVAYTSAKTAMVGLTRSLAVDWAAFGVRVNAIAPGFIYSEMSKKALDADPERKAKVLGRISMGERGEAQDIGWAAVYLCSPAAKYVTGTTLVVDGGYSSGF
jgi:NAD(P)-dependent dehydrogenase (short-subunit alcohol dehydrogenase family)